MRGNTYVWGQGELQWKEGRRWYLLEVEDEQYTFSTNNKRSLSFTTKLQGEDLGYELYRRFLEWTQTE